MKTFRPLAFTWLALLVLLAAEAIGALYLGLGDAVPFVGAAMAALVALVFMRARTTSPLSQIFLIAGVFWLIVLLGLGAMDPITRTDFPVTSGVQN
jgi:hypothetical protein